MFRINQFKFFICFLLLSNQSKFLYYIFISQIRSGILKVQVTSYKLLSTYPTIQHTNIFKRICQSVEILDSDSSLKNTPETTLQYIGGCKMRAGTTYIERHNQVAGIIYGNICPIYGLSKYHSNRQESAQRIDSNIKRQEH